MPRAKGTRYSGRGPTHSAARSMQVDRLHHTTGSAAARKASSGRGGHDGVDRTHAERDVEEIEQRRDRGAESGSMSEATLLSAGIVNKVVEGGEGGFEFF